jgi:hypothetical protein
MQGRIEAAITKLLNRENQQLKQQTTWQNKSKEQATQQPL